MHQVLYIVQLPNEEGDMHIIYIMISQPCLFYNPYIPSINFNFFIYLQCDIVLRTACCTEPYGGGADTLRHSFYAES